MQIDQLWLNDFRSYQEVSLSFAPGLTVLQGPNGYGKTNLLEAVGYLATLESFRGAPNEAMIRAGSERAIVRAKAVRGDRELLLEAELVANGRNRTQINRQPLRRARDLLGALRVTVFAPDDLVLVKGGPGERRRYLDDALVAARPRNDVLRSDVDRVLRQRNSLLKQSGGRLSDEIAMTLDVWDAKFAQAGEALARARRQLVIELAPVLHSAYQNIAGQTVETGVSYDPAWLGGPEGLAGALAAGRSDDIRRGVSLIGPHRDELELTLRGLPARTHASQGEQRSLSLALRLAAHQVVTVAADAPPVLLLDDVFSELDPERSDALLAHLPPGQTIVSTATPLPPRAEPELVIAVPI